MILRKLFIFARSINKFFSIFFGKMMRFAMKKVAYSISALFAIMSFTFQHVWSQSLRLTLRLDADTFLESQGIYAYVAVINQSSMVQEVQPFILGDDATRGIRLQLLDENGVSVGGTGMVIDDDFGLAKPIRINPGDSLTNIFEIILAFSNSGITGGSYLATTYYLRSGMYTLQATAFTGKDTMRSNVVKFEVLKPTGNELRALQLLKKADQLYNRYPQVNLRTTVGAYENFLRQFPNSRYAPHAYKSLIFIFLYSEEERNKEKMYQLLEEFLTRFPEDGGAMHELMIMAPLLQREGKIGVLEKLAREYPQTKVGQFSKRKLLELQQQR